MSLVIESTDGYKLDHRRQYPEETVLVYSNWTPRKSRIPGIDKVVFFGLQYFIKRYLIKEFNEEFFNQPVDQVCDDYQELINSYLGSNLIGTDHIRALHTLGYLPLEIKALPEGTRSNIRIPQMTIRSTHKDFFWLVNYLETLISCELWGPSTSATLAYEYRRRFAEWAIKTGADLNFVPFQGHDFSMRGMMGRDATMASGAAHLLSFKGTDTVPAIRWLQKYYGADLKQSIGHSVAATEHAVMCVGTGFYIKKNGLDWEHYGEAEIEVFKRLITVVYPSGIISIVSDTWDLWKVLLEYLPLLKEEILARDGKLVIRPDSGDPVDIICGIKYTEITERNDFCGGGGDIVKFEDAFYSAEEDSRDDYTFYFAKLVNQPTNAEIKGVVELLWDTFGGTINEKRHKRLDPHIGCIYGDSITLERSDEIHERLEKKGFESTSWIAGIGSYTYQYVTRDTFGYAMKATYAEVTLESQSSKDVLNQAEEENWDNKELVKKYIGRLSKDTGIEIFKDPITDDGTKKSARGLMRVDDLAGDYHVTDQITWEDEAKGALVSVFKDSKLLTEYTLDDIRATLWP